MNRIGEQVFSLPIVVNKHLAPFGAKINEHTAVARSYFANLNGTLIYFLHKLFRIIARPEMRRPQHDFRTRSLARLLYDLLVFINWAVNVKEENIRIKRIKIALRRFDKPRRLIPTDRPVFHIKDNGRVLLFKPLHQMNVPLLPDDRLTVEKHSHVRRIFLGRILKCLHRALDVNRAFVLFNTYLA